MTQRDFFTAIVNGNVSEDVIAYAQAGIKKLDTENEKRRNTPNKTQKENEPIKASILDLLTNGTMIASEIGTVLGISTQKASSLCRLLVDEGKVTQGEVKVKGKGAVKSYSLADKA